MSFENRVNTIKEKNNKAIIEKAKAEERLKNLQDQKAQIEKQCADLGVDPLELDKLILEENQRAAKLTEEAETLLGIKPVDEEDGPF